MTFTIENTNGTFTQDELKLLNQALEILIELGLDEQSASDRINNNWKEFNNTIESLIK